MLYRKTPVSPSRMLLRVAAVAATGALVGACSNSSSTASGVVGLPDDAQGDDGSVPFNCGGVCGTIAVPMESGVDAEAGAGPESGAGADAEAGLPCGTGVCGSVVMPTDAAADGTPDQ